MSRLDVERFWHENELSVGKPFRTDKPRAPIGLSFDEHWLFEELGVTSTVRYYEDDAFRIECNREANRRCWETVGRRPFSEAPGKLQPLRIEEVMGSRRVLLDGGTPWLEAGFEEPYELAAKLDQLETLDEDGVREIALSNGACPEPARGERVVWSRGPTTVATSVIGTERFLIWLYDEPDLMTRFYRIFAETLIRYHRSLAQGATLRGIAWLDDNCALLSPGLYEEYALPAMRRVMDEFAPAPRDVRFQHSDSAMEHLLPLLSSLNFHGVNFGPTLLASTIRRHMLGAEIHGQIAPFTLRNGTPQDVEREVVRDFESVGGDGGLFVTTAGSIPAGTRLESIREFMKSVDTCCRYDGVPAASGVTG